MSEEQPKSSFSMPRARRAVLTVVLAVFGAWLALNFGRLTASQHGVTPFLLGLLFALLAIARPKPVSAPAGFGGGGIGTALTAVIGLAAMVGGIALRVHQFEWLGLLAVFYAALRWALPQSFRKDLLLGMVLLYWIHPLPSQVFGPLQIGMQRLSVIGAEWLLHVMGVGAWGDGLVIRTATRVFGVPEACSGMKTAVTVILCAVGAGTLMRLRWFEVLALTVGGVIQVAGLNMARIAGMVRYGADLAPDWGDKFLHDTMGLFLLAAVVLIQVESVLWRKWKERRERKRKLAEEDDAIGEPEDRRRKFPAFWRWMLRWGALTGTTAAVAAVAAFGYFRSRPERRAELIREVAAGLARTDPANAERAIRAALHRVPLAEAVRLELINILLTREKYEEALREIRAQPRAGRDIPLQVAEARALFGLGRKEEAAAIVNAIRDPGETMPAVSMLKAEFAAVNDQPAEVARHLSSVHAMRAVGFEARIRELFPYLARRNLWSLIAKVDSSWPYRRPVHALIAVTARLKINDVNGAAETMRRALAQWPQEVVLLDPLLNLARLRPGTEWETWFAETLLAGIGRMSALELVHMVEGCFLLGRPDLAWLALRRLETVAPDDPMLNLAPAEYGAGWFVFRMAHLKMAAAQTLQSVNLAPFARLTWNVPPWRELWRRVPRGEALAGGLPPEDRRRYLESTLASLERLEAARPDDLRLAGLFPRVLADLGRWEEAHRRVDRMERAGGVHQEAARLQRAALYRRQGEWGLVYETLRPLFEKDAAVPALPQWLEMADALSALRQGAYAMAMLDEARAIYGEPDELRGRLAAIWAGFGFPEEALFHLNRMAAPPDPRMRVQLLLATGRYREAVRQAAGAGLPDISGMTFRRQTELLPPAEAALRWMGGAIKEEDIAAEIRQRMEEAANERSSFFAEMARRQAEWLRQRGGGHTGQAAFWDGAGRDARERAIARLEWALLEGAAGRMDKAREAVGGAVALLPRSGAARRVQIAVAEGAPDVVRAAYEACPADPEIWLAWVAVRCKAPDGPQWAAAEIKAAVAQDARSAGTLVRAGDYLLRQGLVEAASAAARAAIRNGQGLLAAYVLGIRCALASGDRAWALACATEGASLAVEPAAFQRILVRLKSEDGRVDGDMISALQGLMTRFPDETQWAERLGDAYFRQGRTDDALKTLAAAIEQGGVQKVNPNTLSLAAEAARLEGRNEQAIGLLEAAYRLHPEDTTILNNLIYSLAQQAATLPRALELLPKLVEKGPKNFAVFDTAALVCLRAGQLAEAEKHMERALELAQPGEYAWHEVLLNAAEMRMNMGGFDAAKRLVERVRKDSRRTHDVELRALDLLREIQVREQSRRPWGR